MVNGQPVPCSQVFGPIAWVAGLELGIVVFVIVVAILALILWIWMLVHAIRHPIHDKALWIIIILLFGIIGAIVYYFAVKRHCEDMPPSTPAGISSTAATH